MISVLLYGRNDAHGYNLHRRAALSLNCIAEVLTDPDDEIIFVDYNTPDELPTFIEAISDTLTDRCLALLRVLRVPAAIHRQELAAQTHVPAIEPVARNAGVRRANPSNRWLLSTNTDMVLLPLVDRSLSEICADLPDGFYELPRFELPEWLWERLPRSDPRVALAEVERLGPKLRLDEPTLSHEWIRFDAPGDFQLILRDDFFSVDGFNEEMLLGYHVDSNFSRRMIIRRGSIESLGHQVAGYHCNHNRVPTVYHGARLVTNDLNQFFYSVVRADLPQQRTTWGLSATNLVEVRLDPPKASSLADSVASVVYDQSVDRIASDALTAAFGLTYDSGHVLPFIADALIVASSDVTIGYIGINDVLERLLRELAGKLGITAPLVAADLDDLTSVDRVHAIAEIIVVDLGVDSSLANASATDPVEYDSVEIPSGFYRAFLALERLVQLERPRLQFGEHPRRIVVVNSATSFWDPYVRAQFDCSHTSFHSRVRRATVKPIPDEDDETAAACDFARRLITWSSRHGTGDGRLHIPANVKIEISELNDYAGFEDGWAFPESSGIWTQGRRSELAVALEGVEGEAALDITIGAACAGPGESVTVELLAEGERLALHDFALARWVSVLGSLQRRATLRLRRARPAVSAGPPAAQRAIHSGSKFPTRVHRHVSRLIETTWRIQLPAHVVARGNVQLTFVVDEPRTPLSVGWSDDERQLGVQLRSLRIES